MNKEEKEIYLKIRTEQICEFHNKNNAHNFYLPYANEVAKELAKKELECDLRFGDLRITLEELLLYDNETCNQIITNKIISRARKMLEPTIIALKWWNELPKAEKNRLSNKHYPNLLPKNMNPNNILLIYKIENGHNFF